MERSCEEIFHEARSLSGVARDAYLKGACGTDVALRGKVDALLDADVAAESFLQSVGPTGNTTANMSPDALRRREARAEQPGQMIDRYKLLQPIGEGGFGSVWLAEQREPVKRRVALKIIKLGMDTKQVIARFEAERQALAMMDHPNIAKVLDAGSTEIGRPYFVMEYVRGIGIIEYCDKERLDTRARLSLFIKVCQAIQHAHQKGIIHRDIKPSNVMVTLHDGVPVPKVIDFGVAKATNTELTQKTLFTEHRQMIGTPAYMSPEQAEMSGLDIDTRSDVYSLGVLLYELLTGTTPLDSRELMSKGFAEMMRIIREEEPHKPSTRLSTLGDAADPTATQRSADPRKLGVMLRGDLDWIVMKCLEKDRTRRYDTANGLAADIKRHLSEEPVVAGPPSSSYRMRKFLSRNRAAVAVTALVALFLVVGFSVALAGLVHARREQRAAENARMQALDAQQEAAAERDRAKALEERAVLLRRLFAREQLSLAVLPLVNASGDSEQAYFAAGMTRSLINELNKVGAIDVKSYEAVAHYAGGEHSDKDLALALGVDLLLSGSVLRIGDQVQITMSLDHTGEQLKLWSDTYAGEWSNVFDLQRQVSEDTIRAVQVNWTQQDRQRLAKRDTTNAEAREAYYKGMFNLQGADKAATRRAIAFFDEAIALDPEYALAYLGNANAYMFLGTLGSRPEAHNEPARAAALKALEFDDTLAGAWAAIGQVRLIFDWDWPGAREAFDTALQLDPFLPAAHTGIGTYYASIGEFDLSIEHLRKAIQIEPGAVLMDEGLLYTPFMARRLDVAIEFSRYALDLDDKYWAAYAWMGQAQAWLGDLKGGIASLERAHELEPESPIALAFLASVYAMDGQDEQAADKLADLITWTDANYVCPYEIATVFLEMDDLETAIEYLERAIIARAECTPFMGVDMRMDVLRDDPRFDLMMENTGNPLHGKPMPWLNQPRVHPVNSGRETAGPS